MAVGTARGLPPSRALRRPDAARRTSRLLFRLISLRPYRFLRARGRPCIVFGCAAPRRHTGRLAAQPLRHVGHPFAGGWPGARYQRRASEAQHGAFQYLDLGGKIHRRHLPKGGIGFGVRKCPTSIICAFALRLLQRNCGDRDAQSRPAWDNQAGRAATAGLAQMRRAMPAVVCLGLIGCLTGCADTHTATPLSQKEADDATCEAAGFAFATYQYNECRRKLREQRSEEGEPDGGAPQ
jgi:hypothetical protein